MIRTVLFDFDFTLADSSDGVIDCVSFALSRLGLAPRQPEEIRATIGLPLGEGLAALHGSQSAETTERFVRYFVERADRVMVDGTRIYEPVPDVLRTLRARGCRIGIVSTKFRRRIVATLDRHGLATAVDLVIGGEDTAAPKPDPAGLVLARRKLRADGRTLVYVGDHPVDGRAANAAGVGFVAVLTGMHSADVFADFRPLAVVEDVGALLELLH